ncbi:unnamed protein product [Echinostoma caproni]|uniref:Gamma-glutamyl kinase n=1 Tax=Echinostoma caproni TaxID=27848 RepID=A0A183AA74_9TREM|nr:unnamed protein product [Echinostoma caproni]
MRSHMGAVYALYDTGLSVMLDKRLMTQNLDDGNVSVRIRPWRGSSHIYNIPAIATHQSLTPIEYLHFQGKQCVLVTSGAVALGRHHLGRDPKRSSRGAKAALGMAEMVSLYGHLFEQCDLRTAAMLLTPIDFDDDHRRAYWRKALQDLMDQGVVPIINTNDAVAWDEETYNEHHDPEAPPVRDNDSLAARLACELSSDLLLLVSDVDGVYTAPPGSPGARFLSEYEVEDHEDPSLNGHSEDVSFGSASSVGTGGMESKVASAEWTVRQYRMIASISFGLVLFKAREASVIMNSSSAEARAKAIDNLADSLVANQAEIILANTKDIRAAESAGLQSSLLARLQLGPSKIKTLSDGLKQIAEQCRERNGHVGCVIDRTKLAEGLILDKITAPIGVLMVIFESRPDCLPQVAALSIATANGLLAKPGSEALHTVRVLHRLTAEALEAAGLPGTAVGVFEGRKDVQRVLGYGDSEPLVDLVIPRGSPKMIQSVRAAANEAGTGVPVLGHGAGICHVYVDKQADMDKAIHVGKFMTTCLIHQTTDGVYFMWPVWHQSHSSKSFTFTVDPIHNILEQVSAQ